MKAKSEKLPKKKPYTKPDVRSERVFETMALACSKHNLKQCPSGGKAS